MALYPLCRHAEPPKETVLFASKQIEGGESDPARRSDLLTSLGIFGRLAYPELNVFALIGRQKMRESSAYQEILDEGMVDAHRKDILGVLAVRFGKRVANGFKRPLNAIDDPERLYELLITAAKCSSPDELRAAL